MALEFTILDKNGYPKEHVNIGTDTHWKIITEGKKLDLVLFLRVADYYNDVIFRTNELNDLDKELEKLLPKLKDDDYVVNFIKGLKILIQSAKRQNKPINVIAD